MIRYDPEIHDILVRSGFQQGLSDHQIAANIHPDMSWRAVQRNRQRLNLGLPKGLKPAKLREKEERLPHGPDPTSPVQIAKFMLGPRLIERNGTYVLDRTPISTGDMVREANRIRVRQGLDQVGPEIWRVKP